jgi:hypothetical protein
MPPGINDLSAWLQKNYTPAKLTSMAERDRPLIAMFKKVPAGGENLNVHLDFGNAQGIGATFSQAKTRADATNLQGMKMVFDYVPLYSVATVSNNQLDLAEGAGGALSVFGGVKRAIASAMDSLGDDLETAFFGDGWGTCGRIATGGISGSTATLENAGDVENFDIGMEVQLFASRTSGAARNTPASLIVQGVDRENGKVTFTADIVATIPAAAAGDYFARKTLREDTASPTMKVPLGLGGWVPSTAPTSGDSFGGKDRSVDPLKLAGIRVSISAGTSVRSAIYDIVNRSGKYRGQQGVAVMSWEKLGDLLKEIGNDVTYTDLKSSVDANLNYRLVTIQGPKGPIKIVPSAKCPNSLIYMLDMSTWELHVVNGDLIRPAARKAGDGIIDDTSDDSIQIRFKSYCQLACISPMKNAVGVFA